ncbi:carbon-monoxide dehydrogenase medium subunit [Orenia metallireducens]|uniref:Carbon-monoxide dehydrogenase medium subunit n=1 Tax=Orenia metallireducens TaxID=1413210 RepID=A0A285GJE1_9FIRM|nr:xanthine dehydrogenase family protein subunit M [Orenia metallireducens]PRX30446.1 carbon-monoxide dehydrogenase medium subunit [Orenia metallireducens]SNY22606.1 carbon-monoxide dehydrogenase medium subunit [Orenia metallireducens]
MEYYSPKSSTELFKLLAEMDQPTFLAGGTDLLVRYYNKLDLLEKVVDLSKVKEFVGIKQEGDQIHIGALTTHQEIEDSPILEKVLPALQEAAKEVGSPQIRHRGTIGGNIANASPAADLVPVLTVVDAKVELSGVDGKRVVGLDDFLLGPGQTLLKEQEVLTDIFFSVPQDDEVVVFQKLGKRRALSISVVNLALLLKVNQEDSEIVDIKIYLGSVGPKVLRARSVENFLRGEKVNLELIIESAKKVENDISPIDDIRSTGEYRYEVAQELIVRGIKAALNRLEVDLDGLS